MLQDAADAVQADLAHARVAVARHQRLARPSRAMWVCMPEPLSSKIGFGMKVTVLPLRSATFLMMYLYHIIWSPIFDQRWNFMSISHWPAVATS